MPKAAEPFKNLRPVINGDLTLPVDHEVTTDPRLSLADLGLYVRFMWWHEVMRFGDVDGFIRELRMPEQETRAGLQRLLDAGHLELVNPDKMEYELASEQARNIRAALQAAAEQLSEAEQAAVAHLIAVTDWRSQRASRAFDETASTAIRESLKPR